MDYLEEYSLESRNSESRGPGRGRCLGCERWQVAGVTSPEIRGEQEKSEVSGIMEETKEISMFFLSPLLTKRH